MAFVVFFNTTVIVITFTTVLTTIIIVNIVIAIFTVFYIRVWSCLKVSVPGVNHASVRITQSRPSLGSEHDVYNNLNSLKKVV